MFPAVNLYREGILNYRQRQLIIGCTETMRKFPSKDQDYALWWQILHMRRAMHRVRAKELFQYGITSEEAAVLFIVQAIGPRVTPAMISRFLLRERHSVSGLLSRMEKGGLVRKVKDLERKNLVRIAMTEKGQQAYQQSTKRESIHKVMSCLSKEERQQLKASLDTLWKKALEELGGYDKLPFQFSK